MNTKVRVARRKDKKQTMWNAEERKRLDILVLERNEQAIAEFLDRQKEKD